MLLKTLYSSKIASILPEFPGHREEFRHTQIRLEEIGADPIIDVGTPWGQIVVQAVGVQVCARGYVCNVERN